jgi:hypothetical protein
MDGPSSATAKTLRMNARASPPTRDPNPHRNPPEFSLVQGGLLYKVLRRAHLAADSPEENFRRVAVLALLAWLPLLLLTALEGRALGGGVTVPFLLDIEAHVRFLVALPLLILAEVAVKRRLPPLLRQFVTRRLIPENSISRFEAAVASAFRLGNSVLAEILIIAFVYGVGILIVWRYYLALDAATWYATPSGDGLSLTLAGNWYNYVSLPIVHFLLFRWYWRLFIWARFLWQVSRIELSLVPAHADRAGGLGFLASTGYAFAMFAAAHGAIVAGRIASRIFLVGATLPQFADEIGIMVIFMLCVVLCPLLVFAPQLAAAKQTGLREYGTLEESYVRAFEAKWLRGAAPADEIFVGSADIQSMADLSNCYEVVRKMRIAPITNDALVLLVAATLFPIAPLLLTMIPLSELLKKLLGVPI